jgi:opacity protein-like surface antigen
VLGVILVPSIASAQGKPAFADSWYWGGKGGLAVLRTSVAKTEAPVIGGEWLITRSRWGLNLSFDQAYFDAVSTVEDAPTRGVVRRVDIRDMRRFTMAMNAYPTVLFGGLRPYAGLGYAINFVTQATSEGNQFENSMARDTVLARIEDSKTRGSWVMTGGLQLDFWRLAPFAQATIMPTKSNTPFFINGNGFSYYLEAGLRVNFGSSIEKLR